MNEKQLIEKRNDLQEKMEGILNLAKNENRAMNEEEIKNFDEMEKEIKNIDATLERNDKINKMEVKTIEDKKELTQEEKDIKAFAQYIRNVVNGVPQNAETQLTKSDNGAIIPRTIARKIIDKVVEISPLYASATKYDAKGTLAVPKYDDTTDDVTVAYAAEFDDLVSHSGKFNTVELTGFLIGALTKISKSLLNNNDFNLTDYVVTKMAEKFKLFYEGQCLNGTASKI